MSYEVGLLPSGHIHCFSVAVDAGFPPELLFRLRGVDHEELIAAELDLTRTNRGGGKRRRLETDDLSGLFGVDVDESPEAPLEPPKRRPARKQESEHPQQPVASSAGEFVPSSDAVVRLRKRFGMNKTELARLVGVTAATVANWEKADRELRLRRQTLCALQNVAGMTPEEAAEQLTGKKRRRGMHTGS